MIFLNLVFFIIMTLIMQTIYNVSIYSFFFIIDELYCVIGLEERDILVALKSVVFLR